jgi:hypothetical protein
MRGGTHLLPQLLEGWRQEDHSLKLVQAKLV